jgi:hypothetical protein
MASGSRLGKAFVSIEADTSLFRTQTIAGVTKAVAGINPEISVGVNTKASIVPVQALKRRLTDLTTQLSSITITANGKPADKEFRRIGLRMKELAEQVASITMKADTSKLDAQIARETAHLRAFQQKASALKMDANDKALVAKIAGLEYQADRLQLRLGNIDVNADPAAYKATISKFKSVNAEVLVLRNRAQKIKMGADAVAFKKEILASLARLEVLKKEAEDIKLGKNVDLGKLAAIEAEIVGLEAVMNGFGNAVGKVNDRLTRGRVSWFGWIGGILSARVALFAGARETSGFHVALDSIVETLAILIPALAVMSLGLGAFAAAAFLGEHTLTRIVKHMQNLQVIADATGQKIPPLTDHFDRLAKTIRPQVFELLGDALGGAGSAMQVLDKLAVGTGEILDRFAARVIVDMQQGGTGIRTFVRTGEEDLKALGEIFVNIGHVIARLALITSKTHIAEFLIKGLAAASNFLKILADAPVLLLALVIGLHGVYLWAGLATTALVKMVASPLRGIAAMIGGIDLAKGAVRNLDKEAGGAKRIKAYGKDIASGFAAVPGRVKALGKALLELAKNPWSWVTLAVVGLVSLGIWLSKTKTAAQNFAEAMDRMVAASTVFNVINTTATALSQTNEKLATSQQKMNKELIQTSSLAPAMAARFGPLGSGAQNAAQQYDTLRSESVKLTGQLLLETTRLTQVSDKFGTKGLAGAMALAALAGVRVQDILSKDPKDWAIAIQRIQGLVDGYASMGQGADQLASDLNALTVAGSEQIKAMGQLNDAYDTFIKITSGPTTGFISFAETLNRFSEDATKAGAKMTGFGGVIENQSKHVRSSSLQLQQDFQETINSAEQLADAMRLTGTSANVQVAAIKDVIQVLIPMAGTNKAAAAEIHALAQEAGGPAQGSLKDLAKWAGKTNDPLADLQRIAADTSVAFSDLSVDAQKLGTALSQDLSKDMAIAVESAVGLQGAMNTFAKDIRDSGTSISKTETDRKALIDDLAALGIKGPAADSVIEAIVGRLGNAKGPVNAAAEAFEKFARDGLGLTTKQADSVWKKLNESNLLKTAKDVTTVRGKWIALAMDGLDLNREKADKLWKKLREQYLTTLGTKTDIAKAKWIKLAMEGLDLTRNAADKLWKKLAVQRLDEVGRKADTTRSKFEKLAREMGVNKDKADLWFDALHRLPKNTNLTISVDAKGMVKVNGVEISAGAYFSPHAAGGFISGGVPGRDSVPGMLMPGEVVVPATMVNQGAVDHLRGMLPGFSRGGQVRGYAAGGLVGDTGDLRLDFPQRAQKAIDSFTIDSTIRTAVKATKSFAAAVARQAAKEAKAASFHVSGGGPVGGDAGANKALARRMFPWAANQWPAFDTLEMHEAGYNRFARNASSGAYGIPQALPPTKMPFAAQAAGGSHAGPQLSWMYAYIKSVYGTPGNAWAKYYQHPGGVGWYAKGGMVPGYASGGTVAQQGQKYLHAWRTRHGGGFGAAWGPVVLSEQIARMSAAAGRATTLSKAGGLSAGQHRFWAKAATDEKRRLAVLKKELKVERSWRYQLQLHELALDRQIRAAGNIPGLARPVRGWKSELSRDRAKVTQINRMVGHTNAFLAAHKPPRKITPPGVPGSIPHTGVFTDRTADLIAQLFAALASNTRVVTLDSGGTLPKGLSTVYNGTGRPESLVPAGAGGTTVVLQNHGVIGSQAQLEDWLVRSIDNLKRKRRI